jgi:glycosyltransferase involved in cell wall biosynthesis
MSGPRLVDDVTPLILTYNEAPNIARTLDRLAWAKRVVVVDSLSSDDTEAIARRYPNVAFFQRPFDAHARQWNFGLNETGIETGWVLALDADYILPEDFVEELRALAPEGGVAGYRAGFRYCIDGVPLRGTVYTPVTVLFRREQATYAQHGHTQRVEVAGTVAELRARILHDDRKPLARWFASQVKYMRLEAEVLLRTPFANLDLPDRVRRLVVVAPPAMFLYCLVAKLAILDGWRGLYYACQRAVAEMVLSVFLLEGMLARRSGADSGSTR